MTQKKGGVGCSYTYSVDVRTIEVQVPFAQGVIAPISDVDGGEGSSSKATKQGSLRSLQDEVVIETQSNSSGPRITREGTLQQSEDEEVLIS